MAKNVLKVTGLQQNPADISDDLKNFWEGLQVLLEDAPERIERINQKYPWTKLLLPSRTKISPLPGKPHQGEYFPFRERINPELK